MSGLNHAHAMHNAILWVYIVLLLAGGLAGFLKAGSKVSLVLSAVFAALLVLTTLPWLFQPAFAAGLANVLLAALVVVFAMRLAKTRKFMPGGLMLAITAITLALRNLHL